ncbi:MAG: hypothetical protein J6X55_09615, partial [Victivallales bacterium]|nr:hypothetical protein [Victivallales bacterium]
MMKKWFLMLLSLSCLCMAQENLWPDREFDATGVNTEAHSGEKAGYFTVSKQTNWASFRPTTLKVEPYAVYRATAWVKCEKGSDGSIHALFTYGWNSFGWDFQFRAPLKPDGEWHQVSVDFWGPDERHDFLPLIAEGSSHVKAWIDELEIVKIKSGADHIAQLQKLARPTSYMARLLARFYQRQGDLKALKKMAADTDPISRADIDCLIVRHKMDPDNDLDYIADMIANGGICTPRGPQVLKELLASLSFEQRATVLARAFLKGGNSASAHKAWDVAVGDLKITGQLRVSEFATRMAKLDTLSQMFQEAEEKKLLPQDVAATWYRLCYRILMDFERKRANLGRRVVKIDGVALRADTHVIVLPEEPTPSEQFAAKDLAYHLEEMTGQSLEILVGPGNLRQYPIFIGRNRLLEKYGFTVDYERLGLEGIHVESNPQNHALLLGGGQRGVMYSVYTLLDDFLGCRWFTTDCSYIPKAAETVELKNLKKVFVPYLEQRDANYTCNRPPEFGVRNKMNGESIRAGDKWGGHIKYCGFVHTFDKLVPSAVYAAEHPEYYSEIN